MLDKEILIVDDEKDLRDMICSIFSHAGYTQLVTAASGEEALALLSKKMPGIIIMDVMMPGLDGFALLQEVRAVSSVPVLMLTAKGEAEDRFAGFELGADDYLVKPFLPKELLLRVRAILKRVYSQENNIVTLEASYVDLDRAEAVKGEQRLPLTAKAGGESGAHRYHRGPLPDGLRRHLAGIRKHPHDPHPASTGED